MRCAVCAVTGAAGRNALASLSPPSLLPLSSLSPPTLLPLSSLSPPSLLPLSPSLLLCLVNHRLSHLEDDICDLTLDWDK